MVPPLSFMIDTQDAIRQFFGYKRMDQPWGHEERPNLSIKFKQDLWPYVMNPNGSSYNVLSTLPSGFVINNRELPKMLAGFFILDYFTKVVNYTIPKPNDLIISKIKTS